MTLPPAPSVIVGADGLPLSGRYAGQAAGFDWSALAAPHARGPLWRRFHHKRWHYAALYTQQVFCAVAIVDLGWSSKCFAYAFDRDDGDMLANFSLDARAGAARVAGSADGASTFTAKDVQIVLEGTGQGCYRLALACPYLEIDAAFGPPAAPLLLAAGPVAGGSLHATQKSPGMPASGQVRLWRGEYDLAGGVASLEYANGLLARRSAWRSAAGHALDMGFNLQTGYFGGQDNALWLDGQVLARTSA